MFWYLVFWVLYGGLISIRFWLILLLLNLGGSSECSRV